MNYKGFSHIFVVNKIHEICQILNVFHRKT